MPRTLQTTWAKLSLAARARFPRTAEEQRQDERWVADNDAIRVAAEGPVKKAEGAEEMEEDGDGWHEAADGWYEAAEDAVVEEADVVHHDELAELNAAIELRLAEMTRESTEHEASIRIGRRRLGDLIGRKNELIAQEEARRLLQLPSPPRRAHDADEQVEMDRQQRTRRRKTKTEARDAGLVRLEAEQALVLRERAAGREREMAAMMSGKRTITPHEAERALALAAKIDRRRTAAERWKAAGVGRGGPGPSSC